MLVETVYSLQIIQAEQAAAEQAELDQITLGKETNCLVEAMAEQD
jgi:hypothetical protein